MAKIQSKKDIIKALKEYNLSLDKTYTKNNESFLLICDAVIVNEICFRDIREVRFIGNTMWIDNATIEVKDVKKFSILFTTVKYEKEYNIKIDTSDA